jgi:hypothetical protein
MLFIQRRPLLADLEVPGDEVMLDADGGVLVARC